MKRVTTSKSQLFEFCRAICQGDSTAVSSFLAQMDVESRKVNAILPLHQAVEANRLDIIQLLLTAGFNVNTQNNEGETPLHIACRWHYLDILQTLIATGADVNVTDNDGDTPLGIASFYGYTKILPILITAGADVNKLNQRGKSGLYFAAYGGHLGIVQALIAAGAGVNTGGNSPLHIASSKNYLEILQALIAAGANVNAINREGETPLDVSAFNAQEIVKCLLHHGAFLAKKTLPRETRDIKINFELLVQNWLQSSLSADQFSIIDWQASVPWILRMLPRVDYWLNRAAKVPAFSKFQEQGDLLTLFHYLTFMPNNLVKLNGLQDEKSELSNLLKLIKEKLSTELIDMIQFYFLEEKRDAILILSDMESTDAILLPYVMQRLAKPTMQDIEFFRNLNLLTWRSGAPDLNQKMTTLAIHT